MIDPEEEFRKLTRDLELDPRGKRPDSLDRIFFLSGIVSGIQFGTETMRDMVKSVEFLGSIKDLLDETRKDVSYEPPREKNEDN